ncbi:contains similarity to reverse transcriptase-like proteins [Arabidopsis thaliana]|uniref:F21E10.8 protein n=1 Tax=Arabidopsis thaliana TaxID=3702 RepID=O65246_ARATH|nr:contains similarity to reverse transcriptase-like proteins [Arabidopsis thaliana]
MLWRAISKALPTCSRLVTRGMNISPYCSRCLTEEESICHVLFTCPYAMRIWRLSNLPQLTGLSITHDVEENISLLDAYYNNNHTTQQKVIHFWLIWKIWKAHNNLVLNNYRECPSMVIQQTVAEVYDWTTIINGMQAMSLPARIQTKGKTSWMKHAAPFVKCNFDAGFQENNEQGMGGWILRDHYGEAKAWGSSILDHVITPLDAETKALIVAMQQVWIRGYKLVQFEGGCEVLINAINGKSSRCEIASLLHDIDYWSSKFSSVTFRFTNRLCNNIAHHLVSLQSSQNQSFKQIHVISHNG